MNWTDSLPDALVYAAGITVAAVAVARWWRCGRPDPLRDAPPCRHRFDGSSVVIAMLTYFLALFLAGRIATTIVADAETPPRAVDGVDTGAAAAVPNVDEPSADRPSSGSDDGSERSDQVAPLALIIAGDVGQVAGLAACLVLAGFRFEGGARRFLLGGGNIGRSLGWALGAALVCIPLCDGLVVSTSAVLTAVGHGDWVREHSVIQALVASPGSASSVIVLWGGAVVIAPMAEEAFFRGLLQSTLRNVHGGRWIAIVVAACAFGAAHAAGQTQAVPALFALAIILGAVYERTGSLIVPMLAHSLFNLKTMVWVTWGQA